MISRALDTVYLKKTSSIAQTAAKTDTIYFAESHKKIDPSLDHFTSFFAICPLQTRAIQLDLATANQYSFLSASVI